jgi:hypothetical protein
MLKKMDNKEEYNKFTNDTLIKLREYEKNISYIMMSKKKLRGVDYEFLNNLVLFEGLLDFKIFNDENKNTKRSICTYLYNIYMTISVLNMGGGGGGIVGEEFIDFVKNLQKRMEDEVLKEEQRTQSARGVENIKGEYDERDAMINMKDQMLNKLGDFKSNNDFGNKLNQMMGDKGILDRAKKKASGFNNIFENLMGNSGILSMATELSKNIQEENIDPMSILSSMMSGKPDETVQRLIQNISGKLEEKINNGEIDKGLLEEQAKNIFELTNIVEEVD